MTMTTINGHQTVSSGRHLNSELEADFDEFEQNRMYPLGYGKESTVKRLTLDHVSAISHAEQAMIPAIVPSMSPVHRKSIEDDIERLTEVKRFVLQTLYQPGLPFNTEIPEHPDPDGNASPAKPDRG